VIVLIKNETLFQHGSDFDAIIAGASGDEKTKKLAAQLIFRYFSKFVENRDQALDALFALCENPDINVSRTLLKFLLCLNNVCRFAKWLSKI
jgi:hypothetical protein